MGSIAPKSRAEYLTASLRSLGMILGFTLLWLLWVCPTSLAQSLADFPNPRQENGSWISDRAEVLSPDVEKRLNRRINQLHDRTTAELAIVTVSQLEPPHTEAKTLGLDLFNTWHIGDRFQNNGVLMLIVQNDRRVEVLTGSGLGEILPDAEVDQLIQEEMRPAFQAADPETGIIQGAETIASRLETRLPKTWLPVSVAVGLGILGLGLLTIGYRGVLGLLRTTPRLTIPSQGFDSTHFHRAASLLATLSFEELIAKQFNPDATQGQGTPRWILALLSLGGILLGVAIVLGFQSVFLPTPLWGRGYLTLLRAIVNMFAGMLGILPVMMLPIRQAEERFGLLFITASFALVGGVYLTASTGFWPMTVTIVFGVNLVGVVMCWSAMESSWLPQLDWIYHSDRSGQRIEELTAAELLPLLTPAEQLAQSMGNLVFRGWRDGALTAPFTREQVYLVQAEAWEAIGCRQCGSLTVEQSTGTIEKTIKLPRQKGNKTIAKNSPKPLGIVKVPQKIYTCRFCSHTWTEALPVKPSQQQWHDSGSAYSAPDWSTTDLSTTDSSYSNSSDSDSSTDSSSDFGGGMSDGGGAGSDW